MLSCKLWHYVDASAQSWFSTAWHKKQAQTFVDVSISMLLPQSTQEEKPVQPAKLTPTNEKVVKQLLSLIVFDFSQVKNVAQSLMTTSLLYTSLSKAVEEAKRENPGNAASAKQKLAEGKLGPEISKTPFKQLFLTVKGLYDSNPLLVQTDN